ncbi:MAG: NAD-dependent epimerase/dehydratase family protein [Flavobacteriales bacterium]|nr:NAD-dependent epimerase/dehydratase family protein [Flavobacteriales bacterium]
MDLVTGGTGIVGAHVLLELVRAGRSARAIHRDGSGPAHVQRLFAHYGAEALFTKIEWVKADLLDVHGLSEAMQGVEHVYHAAAHISFDPRERKKLFAVNITGTAHVVNAALEAGVKRLVHVSSTSAVGAGPAGVPRTEDTPWDEDGEHSAYAVSKREAELEVHRGIAEGLDAVMANPCVVLGPGQPQRSSMSLMERLQRGTAWYPSGRASTVDARDVAQALLLLAEHGESGARYLLVGEQVPYRDLFTQVLQAFGHPAPTREVRPWMLQLAWRVEAVRGLLTGSRRLITRSTVSSARSQRSYDASRSRTLGVTYRPLADTIANTVAWMRR